MPEKQKAILLLDEMPQDCDSCPLLVVDYESGNGYACAGCHSHVPWMEGEEPRRPGFCPLRPLPQKRTENDVGLSQWSENVGWNRCLKKIEEVPKTLHYAPFISVAEDDEEEGGEQNNE